MDDTNLGDVVDVLEVSVPCRGNLAGVSAHVKPKNLQDQMQNVAIPYINTDWILNGLRTVLLRTWSIN